ncbi:hypothetical protein QP166_07195 [Sphingomonas sp. LR60]|uniref:hypothetical protein n=1 Tax=Sphingomonas sp. LR60 TaxID=3050233 RepID=UPI002FDFA295
MGILCVLGLHRWAGKSTARVGTTVYRCAACGRRLVLHDHRLRQRKRSWLAAALLISGGMWFVSYNLAFHGRTRVLHTASAAARKAERAASRGTAAIHRAEGDRGAYVDGKDR